MGEEEKKRKVWEEWDVGVGEEEKEMKVRKEEYGGRGEEEKERKVRQERRVLGKRRKVTTIFLTHIHHLML